MSNPDSSPSAATQQTTTLERPSLVTNFTGFAALSDKIAAIVGGQAPTWWKWAFILSAGAMFMCFALIIYLMSTGVGVWGVNRPVMWGWAIINFVWWIGIGHAGTLISAILYLLRQRWRTSIHRAAEAMTIFAVLCAAVYPVIHLGRMWYFWWLFPIPTSNSVWPQFRSPLIWDIFAVSTYFTVSVLFCYVGLIPDLALMRNRARTRFGKYVYGALALGWTGANRHWSNYEKAYLLLAGLATALVLSVHSIVSLDFSASQLPGWHSTIFPPYFVAGAVFSGFGMVLTLIIPLRKLLHLEDVITPRHIDLMCKVMLATGLMVAYAYAVEFFAAFQSASVYEGYAYLNRATGPYAWAFWTMIGCNVIAPQLLWSKNVRSNLFLVFVIALLVNVGMWFERFVIIVTSLHRDFLPSSWSQYAPTWVDVLTYVGTFGLFFTLFLLFIRYLPLVAIAEVKGVTPHADPHDLLGGAARGGQQEISSKPPDPPKKTDRTSADSAQKTFAVTAEFETPAKILQAAQRVREAGYSRWDVFTPFPVHGMDRAMGLANSRVGWFAFVGVIAGYGLGMLMVWWMNACNYPIIVGGKPMFSPHPAFPVCFEMAILLGAFGAVIGLLRLNNLPTLHHPLLKNRRFDRACDDRFFLVIETTDSKYSETKTRQLLESLGSRHIATIEN